MVTKLLKTTIQFGLCALSISRFASVGIDTFGSSVQCKRSEMERGDFIITNQGSHITNKKISPKYIITNHLL